MSWIQRCYGCKFVKKVEKGECSCMLFNEYCSQITPGTCKGPILSDDTMERTLDDLIAKGEFNSSAVKSVGNINIPPVMINSLPVKLNYKNTNEDFEQLIKAFNVNAQILRNAIDRLERLENKVSDENSETLKVSISKKKLDDLREELNKKLDDPDENWRYWATGAIWGLASIGISLEGDGDD